MSVNTSVLNEFVESLIETADLNSTQAASVESLIETADLNSTQAASVESLIETADLDASQIVTGTISQARLPSLHISPYLLPPSIPNAFDDEFIDGSADLALRGYTVVNSSGTVLTRSGDVDPWHATGPSGNTYWSTLGDSWISIQGAPGTMISVYKTITLAPGDTYFCRMSGSFNIGTAASGRYSEVGLYQASGAALDDNNRVYTAIRDDTSGTGFMLMDLARFTSAGFVGRAGRFCLNGHDIRGVRYWQSTDHFPFFVDSHGGDITSTIVNGAPAAANLTRFGVRNLFSISGSIVPQIWRIDFIRKKTNNAWIIP